MCAIHAKVIDYHPAEPLYSVERLALWKADREQLIESLFVSNPGLRDLSVASSSDTVGLSLLGLSSGVSANDAAVISSLVRHRQLAAALTSSFATEQHRCRCDSALAPTRTR